MIYDLNNFIASYRCIAMGACMALVKTPSKRACLQHKMALINVGYGQPIQLWRDNHLQDSDIYANRDAIEANQSGVSRFVF